MSGRFEHIGDTAQGDTRRAHESTLRLFALWSCPGYVLGLPFVDEHSNDILDFVAGNHDWGQDKSTGARRCPMCLEVGPVVTLCMGCEPAFYVDSGPPTYAFNPCGHMATEKTVK